MDTLIGELRIRYDRAAKLLDTTEDELKRLRQVATDSTSAPGPATTRPQGGSSTRTRGTLDVARMRDEHLPAAERQLVTRLKESNQG